MVLHGAFILMVLTPISIRLTKLSNITLVVTVITCTWTVTILLQPGWNINSRTHVW